MSMRTVKIIRMGIENFKGIRSYVLQLDGKSADIFGNNATGKTTIYDALTWLLFGKDSHGNTKFSIKPLDAAGDTQPGIMPTVVATLETDGKQVTLRKQLREKWEKHRGGEERFAGNTVDYYVDDVPMKENQYKGFVSELVDEDIFRMLTGAHRFCKEIKWQDRRKVLFELAGIVSDDMLLTDPTFATLREEINGRTVDDFRTMLKQQRKDVNSKLNLLPARIDECEGQLNELPMSFDTAVRDTLVAQVAELRGQIAALDNAEARNAKRNQIREQELALQALDAENQQHRHSQEVPIIDERPAVQSDIDRLNLEKAETTREIERLRVANEMSESRLTDYRHRWSVENKKVYKPGVCRTCGQPLPAEMDEQAHRTFDKEKRAAMDALVSDSNIIKAQVTDNKNRINELNNHLRGLTKMVESKTELLATMQEPVQVVIEDLPDYMTRRMEMEQELSVSRRELAEWDDHVRAEKDKLNAALRESEQQRAALDKVASQVELRQSIQSRIEELERERYTKAAYIERIDTLLDLCEEFVQAKVERVSEAVNGQFELVSFRLFNEAYNGNLQDCCDPVVDGVPYSDLNSAMQINAGLDCIRTLSEFYGVRVPLFVDNAESVTDLYNVDTQVIRLVVSEDDMELRCEL